MKINNLTKVLTIIFIIGIIGLLFMAYKDIDNAIAIKSMWVFVAYIPAYILYILVAIVCNIRKEDKRDIGKRIKKFVISFGVSSVLLYMLTYIFKPANATLLNAVSISFGSAFGISFVDLIFKRKY